MDQQWAQLNAEVAKSIKERDIVSPDVTDDNFKEISQTDEGMRDAFLQFFNRKYLYSTADKKFYVWTGHVWKLDVEEQHYKDLERVTKMLQFHTPAYKIDWKRYLDKRRNETQAILALSPDQLAEREKKEAKQAEEGELDLPIEKAKSKAQTMVEEFQKKYRKFVLKYQQNKGKNSVIKEIAHKKAFDIVKFDADTNLLNLQDSILNLSNNQAEKQVPEKLLTKIADVSADGNADAPLWKETLNTIFEGNQELINFVQRAFGYSLIGSNPEAVLFQLWGATGRNGKSLIAETIRDILGDYSTSIRSEWLTTKKFSEDDNSATNTLVKMKGKRIVFTSELKKGAKADEQKIKLITGEQSISGRDMYSKETQIPVTWTIWLNTNYKLNIRGQENAIWERIITIPFNHYFKPEERDTQLKDKLMREKAGIFNWLLKGLEEYQLNGLQVPESILESRRVDKEKSNIFQQYFDEHMQLTDAIAPCPTVKQIKDGFTQDRRASFDYVNNGEDFEQYLIDSGAVKHKTNRGYVFAGVCYNGQPQKTTLSLEQWKVFSENIRQIDASKQLKA